jgi:hypothetical protein
MPHTPYHPQEHAIYSRPQQPAPHAPQHIPKTPLHTPPTPAPTRPTLSTHPTHDTRSTPTPHTPTRSTPRSAPHCPTPSTASDPTQTRSSSDESPPLSPTAATTPTAAPSNGTGNCPPALAVRHGVYPKRHRLARLAPLRALGMSPNENHKKTPACPTAPADTDPAPSPTTAAHAHEPLEAPVATPVRCCHCCLAASTLRLAIHARTPPT